MPDLLEKLIIPLLLLAGQLWLNYKFAQLNDHRTDEKAKTEKRHQDEKDWRESLIERMEKQDDRINAILRGQTTQMRSDLIHRAHRYIDDLGKASTEEKESFWAEYEDYAAICDAYEIENSFIDGLAEQVMQLPNR